MVLLAHLCWVSTNWESCPENVPLLAFGVTGATTATVLEGRVFRELVSALVDGTTRDLTAVFFLGAGGNFGDFPEAKSLGGDLIMLFAPTRDARGRGSPESDGRGMEVEERISFTVLYACSEWPTMSFTNV